MIVLLEICKVTCTDYILGKNRMLESFPLLIFLSIVGNVVYTWKRTSQTVDRVVTKEVYVGTTEIPCVVNSWLDELSCMNRKTKTINVTEHRNETVQEIVPMVIKFCCAGYTLVGDRCILPTTESKVTLEAKVKPKPITSDIAAADRTTHIPNDEKDISPDSSSKSVDTRDLLLYVSAACGLLSFITMIVVVGICYQRSKRNNNRRFHNDILSMETVRVNGLNQMHGVENPNYKQQNESECVEPINYREKKQNCNNVYTEMRLTGANQYDDLVGIEEDPYDELPDELPGDYQDCDASPRLYKTSVSPENPYDVSKY
ncbi:unnamed protein product [Mytilus edulis]|uniref:EMI domain-containing protein n=1 Tax=Mytilus edulis TaxID=6550 RepID=A0A8S3VA49_MYTED|nr:unnamed protein product [Mytilus edulis]